MTTTLIGRTGSGAAAWDEKVRLPGSAEREAFVLAHAPLVRYVAQRILSRLPASVELSDLINEGVVGLIEAVERFDPSRGVQFRSYAESRVRGAILDSLRACDVASRGLRRRLRELDSATAQAEQRLGRAPVDEDLAREMGVGTSEISALRSQRERARPVHADPRLTEATAEAGLYSPDPGPFDQVSGAELVDRVAALICELAPRERLILGLYYEEGLTMKEIGAVLEITESRVCQIHARAVQELRGRLEARPAAARAAAGRSGE